MGAMDSFVGPDGQLMGLKVLPPPQPQPSRPVTPTPTATPIAPFPPPKPESPLDPYQPPPDTPDPYTGASSADAAATVYGKANTSYTGDGGGVGSAAAAGAMYGGGIGSDYAASARDAGIAETSSGGDSSGRTVADTLSGMTPSSAGGMPMSARDRDVLIRTVAGEAGSEPRIGQAAVAHVILNRVADGGYGDGIAGVAQAPSPGRDGERGYHEFSTWNTKAKQGSQQPLSYADYSRVGDVVDKVYNGLIPDPTGGATHYYAPGGMPGGRPPAQWPQDWFNATPKVKVGSQIFLRGSAGPGRSLPSQITGGFYDVGQGTS